jgi:predicted O-methyltransferase YrrM
MPHPKIVEKLAVAWLYAGYLLKAKHSRGHGIHSPFVFDLVNEVIFNHSNFQEYDLFNMIRKELNSAEYSVDIVETGAKSIHFSNRRRGIADLAKNSSVNSKFGKLLFRLINYYKPQVMVELGTSLGLSSVYIATGNSQSTLYTIEANEVLCDYANHIFNKYKIGNIKLIHGKFDEELVKMGDILSGLQFAFIDGNHTYSATMRYFEFFSNLIDEGIIVFDDINWSAEMRKAWKSIVTDQRAMVTIDLFFMGIVIKRKSLTPGHFRVRF